MGFLESVSSSGLRKTARSSKSAGHCERESSGVAESTPISDGRIKSSPAPNRPPPRPSRLRGGRERAPDSGAENEEERGSKRNVKSSFRPNYQPDNPKFLAMAKADPELAAWSARGAAHNADACLRGERANGKAPSRDWRALAATWRAVAESI